MSTESTEAIVIRQADFSETSRVVTLFTRDFGKIATIAKGARRLRGPFEGALDLLAQCQIVFIRKTSNSLDILTEARLTARFRPEARSLHSLYGGYYIAELLDGFTEPYDPHPNLFQEASLMLRMLEAGDRPLQTVLQFELTILREIGQMPVFDSCAACGRPVENNGSFSYWVSQSGLLCRNCQKEEFSHHQIPAGTVEVLRRLAEGDSETASRLAISPAQISSLRRITVPALIDILGRRPKMLRYLG